jgi:hypothetical protein
MFQLLHWNIDTYYVFNKTVSTQFILAKEVYFVHIFVIF